MNNEIIEKFKSKPGFQEQYERLASVSSQIVLFGSHAANCQNENSDVDILFVKEGKGFKNEFFDFVTVDPKRIKLKSWLGSELANHIAQYGIWIKGDDNWRHDVFLSESAINRKKLLILSRLAQLWVKMRPVKRGSIVQFLVNIVLDAERLSNMIDGSPVPPSAILKLDIVSKRKNLLQDLCKSKYLGKVGETYLSELLRETSIDEANSAIVKFFAESQSLKRS